jgi:hypothetical protein
MVFEAKKFTTLGAQTKGGSAFQVFGYLANTDSLIDIATTGYFDPTRQSLRVNDVIRVLNTIASPATITEYRVTNIPINGSVTIADIPKEASALKNNYVAVVAPTATNDNNEGYSVGSEWLDTTTGFLYKCLDNTEGSAEWLRIPIGGNSAGLISVNTDNFDGFLDATEDTSQKVFDKLDDITADEIPVDATAFTGFFDAADIDVQKCLDKVDALTNPLLFKGEITLPADFPTSEDVVNGWFYEIKADVTDDDATKTNTGQSFLEGDEIAWNGTDWTKIGSHTAEGIQYDNTASGLVATNVQEAIDELDDNIDNLSADEISYNNTASGLVATDVQEAIDEVHDDSLQEVAVDDTLTGDGTVADPLGLSGTFTPSADSTTAFQFFKADGVTPVMSLDTTNDQILDKDDEKLSTEKQAIAYSLIFG